MSAVLVASVMIVRFLAAYGLYGRYLLVLPMLFMFAVTVTA